MIDCGEGTYGQMVRFFGKSKYEEVLANINAIYVSHIHADHHIGIIGVLQGRKAALKSLNREHKPLKLLAPVQLYPWLSFYDRYFEDISGEFQFISNAELVSTIRKFSIVPRYYLEEIKIIYLKFFSYTTDIHWILKSMRKLLKP